MYGSNTEPFTQHKIYKFRQFACIPMYATDLARTVGLPNSNLFPIAIAPVLDHILHFMGLSGETDVAALKNPLKVQNEFI
jgi:hypothetical protein